ncbi:MAG: hypothetical protein IT460_06945 [Planctomycetes bacterium]|nr:hypothetical protein [Planctomycetota bacterium]
MFLLFVCATLWLLGAACAVVLSHTHGCASTRELARSLVPIAIAVPGAVFAYLFPLRLQRVKQFDELTAVARKTALEARCALDARPIDRQKLDVLRIEISLLASQLLHLASDPVIGALGASAADSIELLLRFVPVLGDDPLSIARERERNVSMKLAPLPPVSTDPRQDAVRALSRFHAALLAAAPA